MKLGAFSISLAVKELAASRPAARWFEKAAEHGDGFSQWRPGLAHVNGDLRPKNAKKAIA